SWATRVSRRDGDDGVAIDKLCTTQDAKVGDGNDGDFWIRNPLCNIPHRGVVLIGGTKRVIRRIDGGFLKRVRGCCGRHGLNLLYQVAPGCWRASDCISAKI